MKQRLIFIAQVFIFILLFTLNFQSCQVNSNEKVNIRQVEKLLNKYGFKYRIKSNDAPARIHADIKDLQQLEQFLISTRQFYINQYAREAALVKSLPKPNTKVELLEFENQAAADAYFAKKFELKKVEWEKENRQKAKLFVDSLQLILSKFEIILSADKPMQN